MTVYQYIKTKTNTHNLYQGIRNILMEMDSKGRYPQDWEIKTMQRLADARYAELIGKEA